MAATASKPGDVAVCHVTDIRVVRVPGLAGRSDALSAPKSALTESHRRAVVLGREKVFWLP